ncbi:uncharacterized protein LOC127257040 [Andrographis paniculata]|uniref:uncharacterized protein LOC127257040 n=1 Tax=Andrographis paniculata TaxID=175694 RepID=UPI0021E70B6A|nr:uncharacterized protein LOC127257040 [Andrographis paniculata]XP_051139260.1 uncharacterized protein LOC127257040 [Andrographis paniculata]XP_051139261.1 uncharacterized protein LOC127257040 [Andrographis paniculata]
MSRISKWKLEKTKVKVVFRLQFHATHIPQTGWDKLFISFIPADSGKATAKTTKANVRNGTCKWGDPIYETTRLLQDSKSKQYDEKLYKFVVSMGSSRASTLGEATINLADYVDALKPSIVALPLQGCNFGTILHITVQLLTSKTGFREFEQQRELRERGLQSGVESPTDKASYPEDAATDHAQKIGERMKLKQDPSELSSFDEEANLNEESADSATGFDGSSHTSESLYAEKHEASGGHGIENLKSPIPDDAVYQCQSPHTVKGIPSNQKVAQESPGSAQGWGSVTSMDNEFVMVFQENTRLRGSLESAESSLLNLKVEVTSLQSIADQLGSETETFSHLIASEISSSKMLEKEVSIMRSECQMLRDDIISLKDLKVNTQIPVARASGNPADDLVQNTQLQFLNAIAVVESKVREIQNKVYVVPHDGDTKFIYLELEALLNFLLTIKFGSTDPNMNIVPSEHVDVKTITARSMCKDEQFVSGNELGSDLCPPESILQHFSLNPSVSEVSPLGAIDAMKGKIFDLVRELDEAKVEKEAFTQKMHQMECYYEALVQELEENQKRLLGELHHLRNEHSACMYTLSSSRAEMESLHEDMNQQMLQFAEERCNLEALNKELERRTTTAEAALRRARLNYSIAVDKLQKDLELLSSQVISMFETNENLIKQALPLTPQIPGDPKLLQNLEDDVWKSSQFQNVKMGMQKRSAGGDVLLEDLKKSFSVQEELYQKVEQELIEMYSLNLNLDVYSRSLQESLHEADMSIRIMKERLNELEEELRLSTTSQSQLMMKLQKATDDIHALNEFKLSSISQCSDMALQNQLVEDKLVSVTEENYLLDQKLKDCESSLMECKSYRTKYEACLGENAEISVQLKHVASENERLTNELSLLKDELTSFKASREEDTSFLRDRLSNLLQAYNQHHCCDAVSRSLNFESMDMKTALLQLEELQHLASEKISQLTEENQNLQSERDIADVSLNTARSEILLMRQKFKNDIQDMVAKLDTSNALVDKLQVELESVASKIHISSEIEENFTQQSKVLFADLALLENQMQELTSKNGHFARDILGLDAVADELGRSKLAISELIHNKHELTTCLQDKTEVCSKLSGEIDKLKEDLKVLHDNLQEEKNKSEDLEARVKDLSSHLNRDQNEMLVLEQQKAELALCLQGKSDESTKLLHEINVLKDDLKRLCDESLEEKASMEAQVKVLNSRLDLGQEKLHMFEQEKAELLVLLRNKTEESTKLSDEIDILKEKLENLHKELHKEKAHKDELEAKVTDLTSCLSRDQKKLDELEQQNVKLVHFRELASDLELEKSRLTHLLFEQNVFIEKVKTNGANQASLESQLLEMSEYSLVVDVKLVYLTNQYATLLGELIPKFSSSEEHLGELKKKCNDKEDVFEHCLAREASWSEEKTNFLISLNSLKSDLEACEDQNKLLSDSNTKIRDQLEECNWKLKMVGTSFSLTNILQACEVEWMKAIMMEVEEDIDYLAVSKEELEILVTAFKGKLDEVCADVSLAEAYKDELTLLRAQCADLSHKLSEQILKTEEFRNLSSHLKELKDKAEAECLSAREKRETEVTPVAANDSLRIAFIKEQYETKVQELKQLLSVSKKHGEEMLMKLQDAINEVENRKKTEAMNLKRNEELSVRLAALESELQSALTEKREKSNAYDRVQAELECALLSLECCKEEKEKVSSFLQYFEAEKTQLAIELASAKEQLEKLKSSEKDDCFYGEDGKHESNGSARSSLPVFLNRDGLIGGVNRERVASTLDGETADSTEPVQLQNVQDATPPLGLHHIPDGALMEELPESNGRSLNVNKELFGVQSLKLSLEHLHEELEKMKSENVVTENRANVDLDFQAHQKEMLQLHKANEELRSMFPLFNEISGGGNALERVLALEIELAEALKAKSKLSTQFHSSFLKQHPDEEAVFKSFRDINELINEMLELKGRHAAMETELREMHDRYSQLSLQFAEVEGEKQKLKMTLKNVRSRKLSALNRTSSANAADQTSQ